MSSQFDQEDGNRPAAERLGLLNEDSAGGPPNAAGQEVITLTPAEQLAFWQALNETPTLTPTQRRLGAVMRGDP